MTLALSDLRVATHLVGAIDGTDFGESSRRATLADLVEVLEEQGALTVVFDENGYPSVILTTNTVDFGSLSRASIKLEGTHLILKVEP